MAFASVGALGTATSSSSNQTSLVLTTTAALEAGNLGVILIAVDNDGTTDGADEGAVSGVVDSAGNTWTKAIERTQTSGAAQDGTVCSIWYCKATTQLDSGGTITISFSNSSSRDASAATAREYTISDDAAIEATNSITSSGIDPPALDATTANISCLRIRASSCESSNSNNWSPTLLWNAFTQAATSGGSPTSNQGIRGEFRIATATSLASDPFGGPTGDMSSVYVALKEVTAGQNLTPDLFTDGDTFHSPTATNTNTLTPALFTDGDTFFSPTVTQIENQELLPDLFTDGDAFFSPTAAATYELTPALFTDGDTFFGPTVSSAYNLDPVLFTNINSFFSPSITTTYEITPALFSDADVFFEPVVSGGFVLQPTLLSNTNSFFTPTVTVGAVNLDPTLFTDPDTFFSATVSLGDEPAEENGGEYLYFLRRRRRVGIR